MHFIGIPIIYPKAHYLRKTLNELLLQNAYVAKPVLPLWQKLEKEEKEKLKTNVKVYISQTPNLYNKHLLLCKFNSSKAYLFNPDSGVFYLFGNVQVFTPIKSFVLDVLMYRQGLNSGSIYIRDVFVWDSLYLADLYFEDRKEIADAVSASIQTEHFSWCFFPTKCVHWKKDSDEYYNECILKECELQRSIKLTGKT